MFTLLAVDDHTPLAVHKSSVGYAPTVGTEHYFADGSIFFAPGIVMDNIEFVVLFYGIGHTLS
jgi:hypothetical protein